MAHIEAQLISRIIYAGRIADVLEWGITEEDFRTPESHTLFGHLRTYFTSPESVGSVPGSNCIQHKYPNYERSDDASMTTDALCNEVRKNRITIQAKEAFLKAMDSVDIAPVETVHQVQSQMHTLQSLGLKTVDQRFSVGIDDVMRRYNLMEQGIGYSTVTWPWEPMNAATAGIQDDDYIVLYGRPKSMKSFVLSAMAAHNYNQDGKHVLIYTKEMPAWQLFRRITGFIGQFEYDALRLGKLSKEGKAQLEQLRAYIIEEEAITNYKHSITVLSGRDAPAGTDSMSWLRGKIDKYKPDIVFIDGLYLMSADKKTMKDHERVMSISRAARQMVLDTHIPLIATMQANRAAAKHRSAEFDEIAYSDAIGQDATVAIRVINEQNTPTIALVMAGSREFKLHGIRIMARPCEDFSYKETMTEKEIRRAKEGDTQEEADKEEKKPIRRNAKTDKQLNSALERQLRAVGA